METLSHLPELTKNIILTNTGIIQGPEIADHAFALLLALTRNLKQYIQFMDLGWVREGPPRLPCLELRRKTMLIVGLGGIGTQIAQRASAFEMKVLGIDPRDMPLTNNLLYVGNPDELDQLLPKADIVVIAAPPYAQI